MSSAPQVPQQARPWNPNYTYLDRERWTCIYPAYINNKRSVVDGRRIPKNKAVENPTYSEIRDVVVSVGLSVGVENKVYPRERDVRDPKFRGRIRVQLKKEDGTPALEQFPSRKALLLYLGEMIPKLKSRQQSSTTQQSSVPQQGSKGGKKKGRKGK